jgi:hypothetical protein
MMAGYTETCSVNKYERILTDVEHIWQKNRMQSQIYTVQQDAAI